MNMAGLPASPSSVAPPGPALRDIHLPSSPSWWPPAPGWWALGVLLLSVLLGAAWLVWRRRVAARARRRVLAEVDRLLERYRQDHAGAALAGGLHQLLRRVARRHDAAAAHQRGDAWRRTLARMPVDAATLDRLQSLEQAIYRPASSFDHEAAASAVRQWLQLALRPRAWRVPSAEQADA